MYLSLVRVNQKQFSYETSVGKTSEKRQHTREISFNVNSFYDSVVLNLLGC